MSVPTKSAQPAAPGAGDATASDQPAPSALRILVVDDHPEFVESATRLIRQDSRFEIIGVAGSGEDAIRIAKRLSPDVVLMDLSLPGMNGLESTRQIKRLRPAPRVIVVSLHSDYAYRLAADEAGADGFLSKQQLTEHLAMTIAKVTADEHA